MFKCYDNLLQCCFDIFFNLIFSNNKRSAAKESHYLPQVNEEQIMVFLIFVFKHQKFGIQFIKILIETTTFNRFENIKIELRNY